MNKFNDQEELVFIPLIEQMDKDKVSVKAALADLSKPPISNMALSSVIASKVATMPDEELRHYFKELELKFGLE